MPRLRFDFEGMAVFQRSLDLLEETDQLIRHFQGHRKGLGFNMYDAAGSVVFNIAESRGRRTMRDRAHFLDMANGSAHETGAGVCIADRLNLGPAESRARVRSASLEIIAMLTAMTKRMRQPRPNT